MAVDAGFEKPFAMRASARIKGNLVDVKPARLLPRSR